MPNYLLGLYGLLQLIDESVIPALDGALESSVYAYYLF